VSGILPASRVLQLPTGTPAQAAARSRIRTVRARLGLVRLEAAVYPALVHWTLQLQQVVHI